MARLAALLLSLSALALAAAAAFARPVEESTKIRFESWQPAEAPRARGTFGAAQAGTTYFGGTAWNADSLRWEALVDSIWTFDTGVGSSFDPDVPGVNPHKLPGLHTLMEGWIGVDLTYNSDARFRRLAMSDFAGGTTCVGDFAFGTGVGGNYSYWAGLLPEEAAQLCYASGQGYGNNWTTCIAQTFAYNGSGGASLAFDFVNETEGGFDFTYVHLDTSGSTDGSGDVEVFAYTGSESGSESLPLIAGVNLPSAAADIRVSFCFVSDPGWSDEDGQYPTTCGAFAVDNISLSGGGISHFANFETGDDGWQELLTLPGPGGEWSNLVHVDELPPTATGCPCVLADSVMVFEDLTAIGHNSSQANIAASPWIDLKAAGLVGVSSKFVEYDAYVELPLLNYMFVRFFYQYYPATCGGNVVTSPWEPGSFFLFYNGVPGCVEGRQGLGIPPEAEQVRIGLGVVSLCGGVANCTGVANSTPWFDNIRFGVADAPMAPLISLRSGRPVDAFPENGTLRINAPGRIDGTWGTSGDYGVPAADALFIAVEGENAEVRVQFAVDPGPGIDPVAFSSWLTSHQFEETRLGLDWYSSRMDTSIVWGDPPYTNPGFYATRYHEDDPNFRGDDTDLDPSDPTPEGSYPHLLNDMFPDDLFTPGSRVNLFYKARFLGSSEWSVEPDTTGGNYLVSQILPSSMDADSSFNCVLLVDRGGNAPAIEAGLAGVLGGGSANFENTAWDRYTVVAPVTDIHSFSRPRSGGKYGATVTQALGYQTIIWATGETTKGMIRQEAELLLAWLTLLEFPNNNLYVTGDENAWLLDGSPGAPRRLLEDLAGVTHTCRTFSDGGCPPSSVDQDTTNCVGIDPVTGAAVADPLRAGTQVAHGNGCPWQRSFDVLSPNPAPLFGAAIPDEEYIGEVKTAQYASIANDAAVMGPLNYRTVVDGFALEHRRDPELCAEGAEAPAAVEERLREVLEWFGHADGTPCSDPTAGIAVESGGPDPIPTTLGNVSPNPLPGGATGRIRFTMNREATARIDIFDLNGRLVKTVFDGRAPRGDNQATWDGTDAAGRPVAGGVYFYRLRTPDAEQAHKVVLVRRGR